MKFWAFLFGVTLVVGGEITARGLIERGKRGHQVMGEVARSMDENAKTAKFKDEETRRRYRQIDDKLSVAMHWGVEMIPREYALSALLTRVFTWSAAIGIFCLTLCLETVAKRRRASSSSFP
jgi:hypothetical protein